MSIESVTANVAGTPRSEMLNGREHLVVPMTLIVPGVLNGSQGPLYYPADELGKNPDDWNGMPMVVYHPTEAGRGITARQPSVYNSSYVGTVFNARFSGGKLVAEGWFDVERTRRVDSRILTSLQSQQPIELSTGLKTEQTDEPGTFNSIEYKAVARNYKPDHLAILPDEVGACSLRDGCGVLINTVRTVMNEKSFNDVRQELETQLRSEAFGAMEEERYVVEVFADYFILFRKGKLWRMNYKVENDVLTILDNTPVEVQLVTSYVPITQNTGDDYMAKLNEAKRKEIIDDLIANCECWKSEGSKEVLNAMPDDRLTAESERSLKYRQMEAVHNAALKGFKAGNFTVNYDPTKGEFVATEEQPTEDTTVENQKPKTTNEWLAEAPPEVQQVVRNAMRREQAEKDGLIETIISNERNAFTKEDLNAMSIDQLEKLSALAVKEDTIDLRRPNYAGAAGGVTNRSKVEAPEPLMVPVMNFSDDKS